MPNHKHVTNALFIFGFFLVASYILPIHLHPYRTFYQDCLAILGVILILSYLGLHLNSVSLRVPNTVIVPFGLMSVIGVQTSMGMILYPVDMVFPVIYLLCLTLALIVGASLAMQEDGLNRLGVCLAASFILIGFLSVFFQHIQLVNLNWTPYVNPILFNESPRPYANVAQPNLLALALCFAVASVWYLHSRKYLKPWKALILVVIFLWGLALTQSRIAWIILPVYVVLCCYRSDESVHVSKPLLFVLLLAYIGFVFSLPHLLTALGIVSESVQQRASQTSVRLVLWQQAWAMSQLHPWFGVGWFQFGPQQIILSSIFNTSEYSENAHNIVLNFAAEIGWPLTLLLGIGTLYWVYTCCFQQWKRVEVRFISLMLLATAIHSLVEFPLWYGFILMPVGVMVGALHTESAGWKIVDVARGWIVTFTVASLIVMGGVSWDYLRVVEGFVALVWQQKDKTTEFGSLDKPELTLFSQFYDYFHIIKIDVARNMSKEDIRFLERASLRFGFTPVLGRLALAYAFNQRQTEALQVLKTIYRTHHVDYQKVYVDWSQFAKNDPSTFAEIVKRLPEAERPSKSEKKSSI